MSIIAPRFRVHFRGLVWSPLSGGVDRELGVPGPDQSPMGSGMVAATGQVVLARPAVVSDEGWSAWRDNPPAPGEPVRGEASVDGGLTWVTRFVGSVDDSGGSVSDVGMSMGLVDDTPSLDYLTSINPLNFLHPSPSDGVESMSIGLHPVYVTNVIARRAGFYATAPIDQATTILSVPMMGSVWPERGTLVDADTISATAETGGLPPNSPQYKSVPWGLTVSNVQARYKPSFLEGVTGRLTRSLGVRMQVGPTASARSSVILRWPTGASLVVGVSNAGVTVDVRRSDADGIPSAYATRTRTLTTDQQSRGFSLDVWITPDGGIDIIVDGVLSSHTPFTVLAGMTDEAMSEIGLYSSMAGPPIGGVVVVSTSTRASLPAWTPSFLPDVDPDHMIWGVPAIVDRSGLELMREQAAAELSSLWIDEDGMLRYVSRTRMDARAPVRSITHADVVDADWKIGRDSVHTEVRIAYQKPHAKRGKWATVIVWESANDVLAPGEEFEEVIHPPEGEDWIDLDMSIEKAAQDGSNVDMLNAGYGSIVGATTIQGTGSDTREVPAYPSWYGAYVRRIDAQSFVVRVIYTPPEGATADLSIAMPAFGNTLRQYLRGRGLLLRASARVTWQDVEPVTRYTGAQLTRPRVYEHDAGWWIQSEYVSNRIADRWQALFAQALPVHGPVEMASPDLSIRLGDTITLDDQGASKAQRVCGISESWDDGGYAQTLTLRQIRP